MGKLCIYKMYFDGKEAIGTAVELAEVSGYCPKMIGAIARNEIRARKGVYIEKIGNIEGGIIQNWRTDKRLLEAWDMAVARFKNVEWVSKDSDKGLKLEVTH